MKNRRVEPERMDDPALDARLHRRALAGLRRLNAVSRSAAHVFSALRDLAAAATPDQPLRVLDIAAGGGDVTIGVHQLAACARLQVRIEGCDVSETAIECARRRADDAMADVEFFALNALSDPIPSGYDVVMCSLFLHHLMNDQAVHLLRRMAAAARRRIIVNDLLRSRLNLALVWLGAHLLTRSRIVHTDALRSVRAAFTLDEAHRAADRAALRDVRIMPRFPCRFLMTWDKM